MPGTGLLAPYNESMCLGQGFNSFLQAPRVYNAVTFNESKFVAERADAAPAGVSQVVSYSARFVDKISDVVRTMNLSAGSSIKSGSIEGPGNSLSVDETKFLSSDLNVVVSVKVMNQTTRLVDPAVFNPIEHVQVNNDKFLDIYGDCYISGFIEGGELHGIVSIKVLDASNKKDIERAIKEQWIGIGGAAEVTDSEGSGGSQLISILSKTETTICVSWSGGGQIKSESGEWSLDTLLRTAAAFPARVASCPQHTWAILTKYDNDRDFVLWADKNKITIPQYQGVQAYVSDLLDMYMAYKNNIAKLQAVLQNPKDYVMSSAPEAISTTIAALAGERKKMKAQMGLIVKEIDILCIHPEKIEEVEERSQIRPPEEWAIRLPVPACSALSETAGTDEGDQVSYGTVEQISWKPPKAPTVAAKGSIPTAEPKAVFKPTLSFLEDLIKKVSSEVVVSTCILPLCTPAVEAEMCADELEFVSSSRNKSEFRSYRFDMPCGSATGLYFNDATELQTASEAWPTRIDINFINWGPREYPIVGWYCIRVGQVTLLRGKQAGPVIQTLSMDLSQGEFITKVKLAEENSCKEGVPWIMYVEVETSQGRVNSAGHALGHHIIEGTPPAGFLGLKGFYGRHGEVVDRMGAIWGRNYP